MKSGFITAADVAREAGVSRSAVSRTFTPGASVSRDVRERILRAAEKLGYRVNRLAQGLQMAQSNLVGVVAANLNSPFNTALLDRISAALFKRDLQCMLLNAEAARDDIGTLVNQVLEYRVRAVIILSGAPPEEIIEACLRNDVRLILINRGTLPGNADKIDTDDLTGGRLAAERMLQDSRRHVVAVRSGNGSMSQKRRTESFVACMHQAGAKVTSWMDGPNSFETGCEAARKLLADASIDGAFCATDLIALGFLDTARFELAKEVPRRFSIIGFDNIPETAWPSYGLTTVSHPVEAFTEAILKCLDDERQLSEGALNFTIPVELIERATTGLPTP
ncbi:LacI family DNA-binding transcriptional regulator [Mesorhizobium sp. NPDC059054]|uniref:LacI family DNA-binding transcriptional regulator n=1 Tax=Mesorhizobium sp. NPDC059054 TaxID=3346711 RepID=UPI0036B914EF